MKREFEIKLIKRRGERTALCNAIDARLNELTGPVFEGHKRGEGFSGLGDRIKLARVILDEAEALLKELSESDPNNS